LGIEERSGCWAGKLEKARRDEERMALDGLAFKNKKWAIRLGDVAGCWGDGSWEPAGRWG
jgi:hypothetical protein